MKKADQNRILGAVLSMTYSLYPLEMTEERNALVRRALALLGQSAPAAEDMESVLHALHQSKYDLNPGCHCLIGNGYYPDDFTDCFRKLDRTDAVGEAARALFAVLQKPREDWDAAAMYAAIRAIYNREYDAARIADIHAQLGE